MEVKQEILSKLIEYSNLVRKEFDVNKILLYGSYAKGTQRHDSDIDVAVLLKSREKSKKIEISKKLFLLAYKIDSVSNPNVSWKANSKILNRQVFYQIF